MGAHDSCTSQMALCNSGLHSAGLSPLVFDGGYLAADCITFQLLQRHECSEPD